MQNLYFQSGAITVGTHKHDIFFYKLIQLALDQNQRASRYDTKNTDPKPNLSEETDSESNTEFIRILIYLTKRCTIHTKTLIVIHPKCDIWEMGE